MIIKLISLVTAIVLGIPVGGVYASADSPSKYLDRLTSANDSSEGMEDETPATVSRAVMGAYGVILNTVDRNADRLEFVTSESHDVVKETKDKANPGAGESTVTYDANGKGSFADGATTNVVTTKYEHKETTKYSHTDNVDDAGVQNGGYGNGKSYSRVVTIPGATSLTVDLTYETESTSYDWVCAYAGANVGNAQCSTSLTGKLGGTTKTTQSFTVNGDSVTFWFRSDSSVDHYYGYYAVVSGITDSKDTVTGSYQEPVDPTDDYDFNGWNTRADGSGENLGDGEVYSPSNQTVYAQWKSLDWKQWNTVGWRITDDGVLKIRPWEGDTGTTGESTSYYGNYGVVYYTVPWYDQRSNIKKVESTGTIVLNAKSTGLFANCYDLTNLTGLAGWDVSNVTRMGSMFHGCQNLTNLTAISGWDVSNVTDMNSMFYNCYKLTNLTPIAGWDVSKVTNMNNMFDYCQNLTNLTGLARWNVSNVKSMNNMFDCCSKLTDLTGLAGWNVSNVTSMDRMFYNCSSLTALTGLAGWNVSNVKSMNRMFSSCYKLTDLTTLAGWDVSNVTSMSYMFESCSNLTDLTGLARWNVSNVKSMNNMFYSCFSLTDLTALASWDVSKVTSMNTMFYQCIKLTDLTALASWDVSKVTNMNAMFFACHKLTDLTGLAGWDVSNVTNMGGMFGSSDFTDLTPIAGWNVSNVKSMDNMFSQCDKLTNLTALAGWDVSNVTDMNNMFYGCSKLTDLTALKDWNVSKVKNMYNMFYKCSNLQKVGIPSIANGGQNLVGNASQASLPDTALGSRVITEDLQLGPYTWDELNTEMTTDPSMFDEGCVWVRYIPSWLVKYDANGGVGSQEGNMIPLNESLTLPNSRFIRFGYKFIGWTTQPDPVSDVNPLFKPSETYKPANVIEGQKIPLYAQWEKINGEEDQPVTGQSGAMPGWVQVDSNNTRNDVLPNQSQSVVFTNKYDPGSTSIQFKFTKLMDGNVPDTGESFQFELIDVMQNKVVQMTTNTGASVQFQPIVYDKGGVYTYYVRETPSNTSNGTNNNPNLDYDDHLVEVVVTVTEEEDPTSPSGRKLKATSQVTGDTTFRNDSKPASLDITKNVTGVTDEMSGSHRDREFTFNVNLLDRNNQPVSGKTYPTTITNNSESSESNGNASSSTSSITFNATGNATVKLKAGSKLTINGIPAYYKYAITETNIPSGYENTSLTNPSGVLGANSHVTVDAVNHYTTTPASASLQAGKILLAPGGLNQAVENGEFRFTLCQVTPPPIEPEPKSESMPEPNAESCTGVSEASNDGNGLVTFPQLTYDSPGTYTYQIREVKGDTLDMTYDSTVYTAIVNVTDNGEGRLVATITYRNNTTGTTSNPVSPPMWNPLDPGAMGVPVFVNRTTVANRLPVTGGRDIVIASVILAMILSCGFLVFLNRGRREDQ